MQKPKEQEKRTWDCCPFKRNTSRLQRRCWENPFIGNRHVSTAFFSLVKNKHTISSLQCWCKEEVGLRAAPELQACAVFLWEGTWEVRRQRFMWPIKQLVVWHVTTTGQEIPVHDGNQSTDESAAQTVQNRSIFIALFQQGPPTQIFLVTIYINFHF